MYCIHTLGGTLGGSPLEGGERKIIYFWAMALILNMETATEICSVAIHKNGELLALAENKEGNQHGSILTLLIQEAIQEAQIQMSDLEAVGLSKGPGSYTGLRVGASAAKGLCLGLDIPLVSIDSLQIIAYALSMESDEEGLYCPMIDARRMEVYTNLYDAQLEPLGQISAKIIDENSFKELINHGQRLLLAGSGAGKCKEVLSAEWFSFYPILSSAAHMGLLVERLFNQGKTEKLIDFAPFYLKEANVTKSSKKLF